MHQLSSPIQKLILDYTVHTVLVTLFVCEALGSYGLWVNDLLCRFGSKQPRTPNSGDLFYVAAYCVSKSISYGLDTVMSGKHICVPEP